MEIITQFKTKIVKWKHEKDFKKWNGHNLDFPMKPELEFTPQLPKEHDCFLINVYIEKETQNATNGTVFLAETSTSFKVRNHNKAPTVEFCFDLIDKATLEFAKIFHVRKQETNLLTHKIPKPKIEDLQEYIQTAIDNWDNSIRKTKLN